VSYFAGLDVSLEETAICIVDDAGKIVRETRAANEPEALVRFLAESEMKMERVCLGADHRFHFLPHAATALASCKQPEDLTPFSVSYTCRRES
jgi:hypothetical protein